jgi:ketosteroid isomerase-like protein
MKFIPFVSLLLISSLFISNQSYSQTNEGEDLAAISLVLEKQVDSWNKGDLEAYMQGYWKSDSLVFIGASGPKYGWKTTLDNYKRAYPTKEKMGQLSFKIIEMEVNSESNAVVIGKWQLQRETDKPMGYFSLFWKKINGDWKIIMDHSSSSEN